VSLDKTSSGLCWLRWSLLGGGLVLGIVLLTLRPPSSPAAKTQPLPVYGQVQDFTLTNQAGRAVGLNSLRGHVWLADIIFTRCAGPCPRMTAEMSRIQHFFAPNEDVKFISLTADPGFDVPNVLKRYGERFSADFSRWDFLTGPRDVIYRLATKDLLLVVADVKPGERESPEDLFLHSTKFVLMDGAGRLRGVFDGENPETMPAILAAVRALLAERRAL